MITLLDMLGTYCHTKKNPKVPYQISQSMHLNTWIDLIGKILYTVPIFMPLVQNPLLQKNISQCYFGQSTHVPIDENLLMIFMILIAKDIYNTDDQMTFMILITRQHLWYPKPDDIYDT